LIQSQDSFKKTKSLTRLGFNEARFFVTVNPAIENKRSTGAEEAGIDKYFLAQFDIKGNTGACCSHHIKGF
jgi:hypothetical protein